MTGATWGTLAGITQAAVLGDVGPEIKTALASAATSAAGSVLMNPVFYYTAVPVGLFWYLRQRWR